MNARKELENLAYDIIQQVQRAAHFLPKEARIMTGRYEGRLGRVDDVIPCAEYGLRVLVYVYRLGTTEVLNSDPQSRTYWPLLDVEFV